MYTRTLRSIFNTNRYQNRILVPFYSIAFVLLLCLLFFLFLLYRMPLIGTQLKCEAIVESNFFGHVSMALIFFIVFISLMLIVMLVCADYMTNKILGPYERMCRELDGVIAENKRRPLKVRAGDEMFRELLTRVNALIKKLP